MVHFNRRHFIQGTAGALGALGLSQLDLGRSATRYGKALAEDTPRKVALLVGVNDYTGNKLGGALNDVELQRRLLIHRFGFNESDVHVLKEEQASRRNILGAFNEYLYEPAQAGDVIVFHFSGHGDRVRESERMREFVNRLGRNCIDSDKCLNTAIAPFRYDEDEANGVQDIMGHTLLLMRAALAQITDNVTFVLDCCYAGGGKRGNAIMRSLNSAAVESRDGLRQIFEDEWQYQQQLLDVLGWNTDRFVAEIQSSQGQGFFVGAARSYQLAADYSFNGFIAGAFTYLLTQHLWQFTSPLAETISMVSNSSTRLADHNQSPDYDPKPTDVRSVSETPIYHTEPVSRPAEALVLESTETKASHKAEPDRLRLWLGGLNPGGLDAFDQGAIFALIAPKTGEELGEVQPIEGTRQGLVAQGQLINPQPGIDTLRATHLLLQEKIRGVPKQVSLKIALDDTLTPDEQALAKAELNKVPEFEVFSTEPGKLAHVLLGRYTEAVHQRLIDSRVNDSSYQTVGSIGIFSAAQEPLLAGSFDLAEEPILKAIARLRSRFTSLHLGRLLALMVNQQAAHLNVSVEVDHLGSLTGTTTRGGDSEAIIIPQQSERGIEKVPVGDALKVTVKNNEAQDLHFGILVIDAAGEINVLFPPMGSDDPNLDVIPRRGSKSVTPRGAEPYGITELLVMTSPQSLVRPLAKLQRNAPRLGAERSQNRGSETTSIEAMDDIFGAMDTRRGAQAGNDDQGPRLLDVDEIAVMSLLFEIVPAQA